MKKEDITYETKMGELRLDFKNPNSNGINFIFLEGVSDVRLFRKFFDLDKCKVESIPGGNGKLEECIVTLLPIHALIVAIRDADFIRINNPSYHKKNIVLTDYHDIETTILSCSESLSSLFSEYTSINSTDFDETLKKLMMLLSPISLFKLKNDINSRRIKFESGFIDLLDFNNFKIDLSQYINRMLSSSKKATVTDESFLRREVESIDLQFYDLFQLTNGHDLARVLASFFNKIHGHKGLSNKDIESNLRVSFNMDSFKKTMIYDEILKWEIDNNTSVFVA
ncbi:hypothetical protein [Psychrobacter sp. BI730]|uniref:hypothetical protein n=1 Tax=Psychrobacter sp. BI730 TaxID=2705463 RepID=UPI0015CB6E23|nr:hypothetical protein [Psychrobacter sp. BI730]NYR08794.1 hypothetical protein [Psychrobacter sp. BI730]